MIKLHFPTNPIYKTAWYNPLQNLTRSLSSRFLNLFWSYWSCLENNGAVCWKTPETYITLGLWHFPHRSSIEIFTRNKLRIYFTGSWQKTQNVTNSSNYSAPQNYTWDLKLPTYFIWAIYYHACLVRMYGNRVNALTSTKLVLQMSSSIKKNISRCISCIFFHRKFYPWRVYKNSSLLL